MELPWMKLYVGDVAGDISGLPLDECGAYLRLMILMWQRGPIPVEDAEIILGRKMETFSTLFKRLLTIKNDALVIDAVLMRKGERIGRSKQAASAANARWSKERMRPHNDTHSDRNTVEVEVDVESERKHSVAAAPETAPKEISLPAEIPPSDERSVPAETGPSFNTFYALYGKKKARAGAFKQWSKLSRKDQQAAIDGVAGYHRSQPDPQFRVYPERYLKNRRWEDEDPSANGLTTHTWNPRA